MLSRLKRLMPAAGQRLITRPVLRRFADDDSPELEDTVITPTPQSDIIQKKFKYKFNNKTLAFVVESPIFSLREVSGTINKKKADLIKSIMLTNENVYVTAILPKDLDVISRTHESKTKEGTFIDLNEIQHPKASEDITDLFYPIGSYCVVELVNEGTISLRALHKAKIQKVNHLHIEDGNYADKETLKAIIEQAISTTPAEVVVNEATVTEKDDSDSHVIDPITGQQVNVETTQNIYPDSGKRGQKKERPQVINFKESHPEGSIHTVEIAKHSYPEYESLPIETRVKIDYLADLVRSLNRDKYWDILSVINYHDLESFIDGITTMIADTKTFKYEDIAELFSKNSIDESAELCTEYLRRFNTYISKMEEIRRLADQNLNSKKTRDFYTEVFNIVKRLAESNKKTTAMQLQEAFNKKNPPAHVVEIFQENLMKFKNLDKSHSEYQIYRNYLEWMAHLPFGVKSDDNYDLENARKILDKHHYGLEDVKKRILEFLAVGKLSGGLRGKILCLQGPPGVGKTSFALSVAEALGRKAYRISMGGESDVAVLKGHRRTYLGSRPGKMVCALKECGTENCVIVIDEIDKISHSNYHGDPQSTLLEILDPEQNNTFVDNYLDFPIDLSNVFFICTANNLSPISPPLLDRMDVININSYTNADKEHIFNHYLYKQAIEENGLKQYDHLFEIKPEVIQYLINFYCREPGIRSLQKQTIRIIETLAYELVQAQDKKAENASNSDPAQPPENSPEKIIVDTSNLHKYIGLPHFEKDNMYEKMVPGVVKGLAYSESGGSVLFIEASLGSIKKSFKGMKTTGNLGDVMKESVKIAYSYARHYLAKLKNGFLEEYFVHVHVPEGATPKDGPSAGIAITSALISLATNRPLPGNFAMTGEVSLKGKVLKIGGVKEKILSAKREGVTNVIVPIHNKEDVESLGNDCKDGMTFHFVEHYDEVYPLLFAQTAAPSLIPQAGPSEPAPQATQAPQAV